MSSDEALKWKKRFERERAGRKEAEVLLENKSFELYTLNQNLEKKIEIEVQKNIQKEEILFHQSKLASMGDMISNIAHQWRQPLQAIGIITQRLQLIYALGQNFDKEVIDDTVDKVNLQLDYLTNTIEGFRGFFIPQKEVNKFTLESVINKTTDLLESSIKSNSIKVIKNLVDISIINLENDFIQVLINIIKNSTEVQAQNNIKNKLIIIDSKTDDKNLIIEIKDNAGGIDNKIKNRVFEPYFTTKHKSKGTGIGLYMSHEIIVKHMKGNIEVENVKFTFENEVFTGCCFKVSLPLNS